jgi:hypothetical protein
LLLKLNKELGGHIQDPEMSFCCFNVEVEELPEK